MGGDGSACKGGGKPTCDLGHCQGSPNNLPPCQGSQLLFKVDCYGTNKFTRYWGGVSNYRWDAVTKAKWSADGYNAKSGKQYGKSYPTKWSGGHWGLVSGNDEATTMITAHSGGQWACYGNKGKNGEGYTGRNGKSNFRLWAKIDKSDHDKATSCSQLLKWYPGIPSGLYALWNHDRTQAFFTYCDMDFKQTDGGGWTLVAVAKYQNRNKNWHTNGELNRPNFGNLNAYWHLSRNQIIGISHDKEEICHNDKVFRDKNHDKKYNKYCWCQIACPKGQIRWGDGSACKGGGKPTCDLGHCQGSPNNLPPCQGSQLLFKVDCYGTNKFTRYWGGVSNYRWDAVTKAKWSADGYNAKSGKQYGKSYPTKWSGGHWGLVSGNNEATTMITAHSGGHWACYGNKGKNGEGYTGRNGKSNFRLWAKIDKSDHDKATSCSQLLKWYPGIPSGLYALWNHDRTQAFFTYCDMDF